LVVPENLIVIYYQEKYENVRPGKTLYGGSTTVRNRCLWYRTTPY